MRNHCWVRRSELPYMPFFSTQSALGNTRSAISVVAVGYTSETIRNFSASLRLGSTSACVFGSV